MKKIIASLISSSIILTSISAKADEITLPSVAQPNSEPDVGAAISPMKKGDKAVFTGLLLSPKAVATVIAQNNSIKSQITIETNKVLGDERAACNFKLSEQKISYETENKIMLSHLQTQQRDIEILSTRLKDEQNSAKNNYLWTGLGVLGGVVLTLSTVFVVSKVYNLSRDIYLKREHLYKFPK